MPKVEVDYQGNTFEMEGSEDDILSGLHQLTGKGSFAGTPEDKPYVDAGQNKAARGDQPMSPWMTGPTAIGEGLKREEAAFAAPLNDFAKGERNPGKLAMSTMDAVFGKRADQFGDALKSFGVGETAASLGGFAMAMALPSNFLTAGSEALESWTPQKVQKMSKVFKMIPEEAKDAASMIFGSAQSVDPRYMKQVLEQPEIFNRRNLDPRNLSEVKRKILTGVSELNRTAPEALHPDRQAPLKLGQAIVDTVKDGIQQYGEQVWRPGIDAVIGATEKTRVPFEEVEALFRESTGLTRPGTGSLGGTAAREAQELHPELLAEIKAQFSRLEKASMQGEGVPRSIGLKDLVGLREDLNNRLRGLYDVEGKLPASSERSEAFLKKIKGGVAKIMDTHYTGPQGDSLTAGLYGGWEQLLGARDTLRRLGKGSDIQLANYISNSVFGNSQVDPMIKSALQTFDDFGLSGQPLIPMIESYQKASANSLGRMLEAVGLKTDPKNLHNPMNRKRLDSLLKNFSWVDSPDEVRQTLFSLNELMPDKKKFWDHLVRHDIARRFNKTGSIFRIGAALGIGGAKGGPMGSLAGAYATIPPVFATTNRAVAQAGRGVSFAVKEGVRRATPALLAGLIRASVQAAPGQVPPSQPPQAKGRKTPGMPSGSPRVS